MTSRKRRQSSISDSNKSPKRPSKRNPFLRNEDEKSFTTSGKSQGSTLGDVISFVTYESGPREVNMIHEDDIDTAERLLHLLEANESPSNNTVSKLDVSNHLLLPWATKNLLQMTNQSRQQNKRLSIICWKIMACCLDVCLDSNQYSGKAAYVSSILTQGALHKLVSLAAKSVLINDLMIGEVCAQSYCGFLNHLYRPTMQTACCSLLDCALEHVVSQQSDESLPKESIQIICSTLSLMRTLQLQGAASPKTIFLLFSSSRVLVYMSRLYFAPNFAVPDKTSVQELVQEVLWEGFFGPFDHIEGFYGLRMRIPALNVTSKTESEGGPTERKQVKSHCYPEKLIGTMQSLLDPSDKEKTKKACGLLGRQAADFAALLMPLLLRGFIAQSSSWANARGPRGRRITQQDLATFQFRFWANVVAKPLIVSIVQHTGDRVALVPLSSLRKSLEIILHHDTYLPVHQDKENLMLEFLCWISKSLVSCLSDGAYVKALTSEGKGEIILIYSALTRLNHSIVHGCLGEVMTTTIASASNAESSRSSDVFPHLCGLFCTFTRTYSNLRKLDFLVKSILASATNLIQGHHTADLAGSSFLRRASLVLLNRIVHKDTICSELAISVQRCPRDQVELLFGTINSWIAELIELSEAAKGRHEIVKKEEDLELYAIAISVAAKLLELLVGNVWVDQHSSHSVALMSKESMQICNALLEVDETEFIRQGLSISGWLIDLQLRCYFWLGRSNCDVIDSTRQRSLSLCSSLGLESFDADDEAASGGVLSNLLLGELQFAACHRVRQLLSCMNQDHSQQGEINESPHLQEARKLVDFSFAVATLGVEERKNEQSDDDSLDGTNCFGCSRWAILSQTTSSWAPFARQTHIDSFLRWFFFTVSFEGQQRKSIDGSFCVFPFQTKTPADLFEQDFAVAKCMLSDATFFELDAVASNFQRNGLWCAKQLLRSLTTGNSAQMVDSNSLMDDIIPVSLDASQRTFLPSQQLTTSVESTSPRTVVHDERTTLEVLSRVLRVVLILNGLPLASTQSGKVDQLDDSFRIDVVMRRLYVMLEKREVRLATVQILCAIRHVAARHMCYVPIEAEGSFFSGENDFRSLLKGLYRSTTFIAEGFDADENYIAPFISATGRLIQNVFFRCLKSYGNAKKPLFAFLAALQEVHFAAIEQQGKIASRVTSSLVHPVIKGLVVLKCGSASEPLVEVSPDMSRCAGEADVVRFVVRFVASISENLGGSYRYGRDVGDIAANSIVLCGDVISMAVLYADACGIEKDSMRQLSEAVSDMCNQLISCLLKAVESDDMVSIRCKTAATYFLSCVISTGFDFSTTSGFAKFIVKLCMAQFFTAGGVADPLLSASFVRICNQMSAKVLCDTANFVFVRRDKVDTLEIASCVHLFTLVLNSDIGHEKQRSIAELSSHALFLSLELLSPSAMTNQWSAPVAARCIHGLIERKAIYSLRERHISQMISSISSAMSSSSCNEAADSIVQSCCLLTAALLQRFPKQLYACTPCVINMMKSIMMHMLESNAPPQQFTRLCDLLVFHKDVFKKHVVGLILSFVRATESNAGPLLKTDLVSAIYHLLDIVSEFETNQLNSRMNTNEKALLGSIFDGYRKIHTYTGQY